MYYVSNVKHYIQKCSKNISGQFYDTIARVFEIKYPMGGSKKWYDPNKPTMLVNKSWQNVTQYSGKICYLPLILEYLIKRKL